jgi:hypothetical protein
MTSIKLGSNQFMNDGFSCSHYDGDDGMPETIVCDGTSLSFQRRMWD